MAYATWNPADKGAGVTLSGGNLGVSVLAAGTDSVRATASEASGKWYFELAITSGSGAGMNLAVGIANASAAITGTFLGGDANAMVYRGGDGAVKQNATTRATFATFGVGDTIGVAFDATARTVSFYKNNILQGTLSTNVPTGALYPVAGGEGGGTATAGTANFGATAFTYTPPTGYSGLLIPTNFSVTGSGGVSVGGAADIYPPPEWVGAGGVTIGGSATTFFKSAYLVTGSAGVSIGGSATVEFPRATLAGTLPVYTLVATAVRGASNSVDGLLAPYGVSAALLSGAVGSAIRALAPHGIEADFGWFASNSVPARTLDAVALVGAVAAGAATLPAYTLGSDHAVENLLSVDVALPVYVLSTGSVRAGVGTAALFIPAHRIRADGTVGAVLTADNGLPIYTLVSLGHGPYDLSAVSTLPAYQLDASGSAAIVEAFRAWALNLANNALTEYTNFQFNSFAYVGDRLFAAGPAGIVELGTQGDDAGTAIDAFVRTGKHNFGTAHNKRVPRIYLAGEFSGSMEVHTVTDADGARAYLLSWNNTSGLQQRRVPIGRGPKSVYWQYEIANREGADFAVDALILYPETGARKVGA